MIDFINQHEPVLRGLVFAASLGLLAGFAAVVGDLALRALAQRGAPALRLAVEAAEEVDPQDGFGALLLGLAEFALLVAPSRRRILGWMSARGAEVWG